MQPVVQIVLHILPKLEKIIEKKKKKKNCRPSHHIRTLGGEGGGGSQGGGGCGVGLGGLVVDRLGGVGG